MDGANTESLAQQNPRPTSNVEHSFFDDTWDAISKGLDQFWVAPDHRDAKLYMKVYQLRWQFCTKGFRRPEGHWDRLSQLYRRLGEYLRGKLSGVRIRIMEESTIDREAGLRLYLNAWQHYKQFAKQADHICSVPGGWHSANQSEHAWGRTPSVWSLHLAQWKEVFFNSSSPADGRTVSQIAEEYSEQADDPSPIIRPFREIASLLERGPWETNKVSWNPKPVDYSVLCPMHTEIHIVSNEMSAADQREAVS
jgi:hypothetical protein